MKSTRLWTGLAALLLVTASATLNAADMPGPMQPEDIKWGPAPMLPAGGQMALLAGDPASSGLVSLRLKMPPGYKLPPHWHPTDEHVTVISGTLALGMGDTLDKSKSKILKAGGYAVAPSKMNHYAWTKTGAVVQVDMMGPFGITYVNAKDDPRMKK